MTYQEVLLILFCFLFSVINLAMRVIEHIVGINQFEKCLLNIIKAIGWCLLIHISLACSGLFHNLKLTSQVFAVNLTLPGSHDSIVKCNKQDTIWCELGHSDGSHSILSCVGSPVNSHCYKTRWLHAESWWCSLLAEENRSKTGSKSDVFTIWTVSSTSELLSKFEIYFIDQATAELFNIDKLDVSTFVTNKFISSLLGWWVVQDKGNWP